MPAGVVVVSSKTISYYPVNFPKKRLSRILLLQKLQLLISEDCKEYVCGEVHLFNSTIAASCQFSKSCEIAIPETICLAVSSEHQILNEESSV